MTTRPAERRADEARSKAPPAEAGPEQAAVKAEGGNGLRAPAMGAFVTLGLLCAIPYFVPGLERLQLLTKLPEGQGIVLAPPQVESAEVGEAELPPAEEGDLEHLAVPEEVAIPAPAQSYVAAAAEGEKPPVSIVDDSGALDAFFAKLAKVEAKEPGAIARIAAWGDSNVASDLVTGVLRRELQTRFGDAGHGYLLLTRTSMRYFHNDVRQLGASGWAVSSIRGPLAADNVYGIGATVFRALGKGAFSRVGTTAKGKYGRNVSRFIVDYLEQPEGDVLDVWIDEKQQASIATDGPEVRGKSASYSVPDGEHTLEVRSTGDNARVFGVMLERDGPGIVIDTLGVTGSKIRYLLRIDGPFFAGELARRDHDLFLFNFGVNEAREGEKLMGGLDNFEKTMREVLDRVRKGFPGKSCLVVSPSDTAVAYGEVRLSFPLLDPLIEIEERVAKEAGCAFWHMRNAMGGKDSMGKWFERGLGEEDMLHPTKAGATILGRWLYLALMERYHAYRLRTGSR